MLGLSGSAHAHPPAGAFDLLPLYAENLLETTTTACAARAPAAGKALAALQRQLRSRERAVLARAGEAADALERAALEQATSDEDVDRRKAALEVLMEVQAQKVASGTLVLQALARATDRQAETLCARQLAEMSEPGWLSHLTEEGLVRVKALHRQLER